MVPSAAPAPACDRHVTDDNGHQQEARPANPGPASSPDTLSVLCSQKQATTLPPVSSFAQTRVRPHGPKCDPHCKSTRGGWHCHLPVKALTMSPKHSFALAEPLAAWRRSSPRPPRSAARGRAAQWAAQAETPAAQEAAAVLEELT